MFPFDVILFDVGGVLLTNGWDHRERARVLDSFGLDRAEFEARHPEPNDAWERDVISAQEYMEATVFYERRTFTEQEFLAAFLRNQNFCRMEGWASSRNWQHRATGCWGRSTTRHANRTITGS